MPSRVVRSLGRGARAVLLWVLAVLILFEEWGWEPLARAIAAITRLPVFRQINAWIAGLPPRAALGVFAVPVVCLLPFKFGAVYLIAAGHQLAGIILILAAKVVGTALTAHLYALTRSALLQIAWFARILNWWLPFKARVLVYVKATRIWRTVSVLVRRWQRVLRR